MFGPTVTFAERRSYDARFGRELRERGATPWEAMHCVHLADAVRTSCIGDRDRFALAARFLEHARFAAGIVSRVPIPSGPLMFGTVAGRIRAAIPESAADRIIGMLTWRISETARERAGKLEAVLHAVETCPREVRVLDPCLADALAFPGALWMLVRPCGWTEDRSATVGAALASGSARVGELSFVGLRLAGLIAGFGMPETRLCLSLMTA